MFTNALNITLLQTDSITILFEPCSQIIKYMFTHEQWLQRSYPEYLEISRNNNLRLKKYSTVENEYLFSLDQKPFYK